MAKGDGTRASQNATGNAVKVAAKLNDRATKIEDANTDLKTKAQAVTTLFERNKTTPNAKTKGDLEDAMKAVKKAEEYKKKLEAKAFLPV